MWRMALPTLTFHSNLIQFHILFLLHFYLYVIFKLNCEGIVVPKQAHNLWSISSTFYVCFFCTKVLFLPKSFRQSQNVTREKLHEALLYKKRSSVDVDEIDTCWLSFTYLISFGRKIKSWKIE